MSTHTRTSHSLNDECCHVACPINPHSVQFSNIFALMIPLRKFHATEKKRRKSQDTFIEGSLAGREKISLRAESMLEEPREKEKERERAGGEKKVYTTKGTKKSSFDPPYESSLSLFLILSAFFPGVRSARNKNIDSRVPVVATGQSANYSS